MICDAESKTPEARGEQGSADLSPNYAGREGRFRDAGSGEESIPVGTVGADREGAVLPAISSLAGGILDQLIQQTRDQLENDQACIDWYLNERVKHEAALERLLSQREQFQRLIEQPEETQEVE